MPTFLVTGATGRIGTAVVTHLLSTGHTVHAYVRSLTSPASQTLATLGATLYEGDFSSPTALATASQSCSGLFLLTTPGPNTSEVTQARTILSAFLSTCLPDPTIVLVTRLATSEHASFPNWPPSAPYVEHNWTHKAEVESVFKSSGVKRWSIIQPGWFMVNFFDPFLRRVNWPLLAREKRLIAGVRQGTVWELVDPENIGAVIAKALVEGWEGRVVKVASQLLTLGEIASVISRVSGIEVEAVFRGEEEARRWAESDYMGYMHLWQRERAPQVDMEFMKGLGIKLTTLEEYLIKHKEELIVGLNDVDAEPIYLGK